MKKIKLLLFGVRAQGNPVSQPTFKTILFENQPTFNEWAKELKVGSRYGHRDSFY